MSLTPERREQRRKYVGSSDVPAILGKSPFRSPHDVYLEKTQDIGDIVTGATSHGTQIEHSVLQWAADQLGKPLDTDQFRVAEGGLLAASHDALVRGEPQGIEAKTAAIFHWYPGVNDEWGDPQTDQVPDHVFLQCQQQCYVSNLEVVWVPCLIGGRGFQMFRVERNNRIIDIIVQSATKFWNEHVVPRVPPNGAPPSIEVAKAIRRTPNKFTSVPTQLVDAWAEAKAIAKVACEAKDGAEAQLLAAMGDAEGASCELGQLTFMEQTRKEHYVKESTFRVLRFKKSK